MSAACSAGGAFTGTESWEQVQRKKDKRLQSSAVRGVLDGFQETLSMFGRHLFVALAVDKKQAKELGAAEKQKLDPRNLHLAKIGVVLEDSPEAKNMPAADLAKRMRDWQEKKSKLKYEHILKVPPPPARGHHQSHAGSRPPTYPRPCPRES